MKKGIIYFFLTVVVIIAANYYYVRSGSYASDIKTCNASLMSVTDSCAMRSDVIYFGESSNVSSAKSDSSHAYISELIAKYKPSFKIGTVTKGAIHAGTYKTLLKRLPETTTVKTIIITVNLRSFGINWIESNLETNLSRANVMYSNYPPLLKKIMLGFKAYDNKDSIIREHLMKWHYKHDELPLKTGYANIKEWDAAMFDHGHLNPDGTRNAEKCALACHFIKNYAFVIHDNNPRLKDFDAIVKECRQKKIKLILHLLPENVESAEKLCGKELLYLIQENVKLLEDRYKEQCLFINNYNALSDSCFIDRAWPTEHYNYYGRNTVAQKIVQKL